jgi:hypothetical protein
MNHISITETEIVQLDKGSEDRLFPGFESWQENLGCLIPYRGYYDFNTSDITHYPILDTIAWKSHKVQILYPLTMFTGLYLSSKVSYHSQRGYFTNYDLMLMMHEFYKRNFTLEERQHITNYMKDSEHNYNNYNNYTDQELWSDIVGGGCYKKIESKNGLPHHELLMLEPSERFLHFTVEEDSASKKFYIAPEFR